MKTETDASVPVELLFNLRKDLLTGTLQRQFEYGKWLLASLVAAHLGSLLAISQAKEAAAPLFKASGSYLIYGVAMALLSGGMAWINFSVASVFYYNKLNALITGEEYAATKKTIWVIRITLYGAPIVATCSLVLFFLAAHTAIEVLQAADRSPVIGRMASQFGLAF